MTWREEGREDIPEEIKKERNNILLRAQAEISAKIHADQIGKTFEVFVEGISTREARKKRAATALTDLRRNGEITSIGLTVGGKNPAASQSNASVATMMADESDDHSSESIVQLSGRTAGDLIAMFDADESQAETLIGKIISIEITASAPLALFGTML